MKYPICIIFICCQLVAIGQTKKLTVGDKVPDLVFYNLINFPKKQVGLSYFKGKHVILDFWEMGCSGCVSAIADMQSLQEAYKDQLQILTVTSYGTSDAVMNYAKKIIGNFGLPTVTNDKHLSKLFPFKAISHVVWIGPDQIVKAITGTEHVKKKYIDELLRSGKVNWPVKADSVIRPEDVFLGIMNPALKTPASFHYSSFTGPVDGSASYSFDLDSANKTAVISQVNAPLSTFIEGAITGKMTGSLEYRSRMLLQVNDSLRKVIYDSSSIAWGAHNSEGLYCYMARIPAASEVVSDTYLKEDLRRWLRQKFGIRIGMEKKLVKVLVLKRIPTGPEDDKLLSPASDTMVMELTGNNKRITNYSLNSLISHLNQLPDFPYLVDETRIGFMYVDIKLGDIDLTDIPALRKVLNTYALDLTEEERELEMYIVSDKT